MRPKRGQCDLFYRCHLRILCRRLTRRGLLPLYRILLHQLKVSSHAFSLSRPWSKIVIESRSVCALLRFGKSVQGKPYPKMGAMQAFPFLGNRYLPFVKASLYRAPHLCLLVRRQAKVYFVFFSPNLSPPCCALPLHFQKTRRLTSEYFLCAFWDSDKKNFRRFPARRYAQTFLNRNKRFVTFRVASQREGRCERKPKCVFTVPSETIFIPPNEINIRFRNETR
jgi:hypothetical protein